MTIDDFMINILPEFAPFWAGIKEGKIGFPVCDECGKFHWYPKKICPFCQSYKISWKNISGKGELFTWTVVRHPFDSAFKNKIPYVVGLVQFKEAPGVRLVSNILEAPTEKLKIGLPLEPIFQKTSDGSMLVFFRPTEDPATQ